MPWLEHNTELVVFGVGLIKVKLTRVCFKPCILGRFVKILWRFFGWYPGSSNKIERQTRRVAVLAISRERYPRQCSGKIKLIHTQIPQKSNKLICGRTIGR